jgi:hypothetical protein
MQTSSNYFMQGWKAIAIPVLSLLAVNSSLHKAAYASCFSDAKEEKVLETIMKSYSPNPAFAYANSLEEQVWNWLFDQLFVDPCLADKDGNGLTLDEKLDAWIRMGYPLDVIRQGIIPLPGIKELYKAYRSYKDEKTEPPQ